MWISEFSCFFRWIILILVVIPIHGDPTCGFPAVPDHADIQGLSWDSDRNMTFEPGHQLTFVCQSNFSDIRATRIKTCSRNGSWIGKEIHCYKTVGPVFHSFVTNGSEVYDGKDSSIHSEVYNREFVGELQVALPSIERIACVRIDLQSNEKNLAFDTNLLIISIGKSDCFLQHRDTIFNSGISLFYSCSLRMTRGFVVESSKPLKISGITAYTVPEGKCSGRPEIPLNALAEMEGPVTVRYRCRDGFVLHGNDRKSCDPKSGLWSPDTPLCNIGLFTILSFVLNT